MFHETIQVTFVVCAWGTTGMTIRVILRGGFSAHRVSPGSTKPAQGCMGRPCTTLYVTNVQDRPRFVVLGPRPYAVD